MENILTGNEFSTNIPDTSIGKLFFDFLKNVQDSEIAIDGVTKESLTYKDIFKRSVRMAIAFKKFGIVEGDVVGLICPNNVEYFVPALSCFYIGAIIHPINPIYTFHEIRHAFDITKPKIVLTGKSTLKSLLSLQNQRDYLKKLIIFGSPEQDLADTHNYYELLEQQTDNIDDFCPNDVSTDAILGVLSSSGTTGLPKAVTITNKNIRICLTYFDPPYVPLNRGGATIAVLPFFHIFGFLVGIGTFLKGVKLVVLDKFKPDLYLQLMQEYKVSVLFVVPPIALFLAKSEAVKSFDFTSLKDIYCGAAPLGTEVQNVLKKRLSVNIKQIYGMTETCGVITVSPIDGGGKSGNCGRLIHGWQLKIEDVESREILGVNKVGEICCKGMATTVGYFDNAEATRELFDDDGFLHTGDIGYYDEDGFLYIVERLKDLIKYKGFQVSPSELEDILTSHEAIKEVGVIGVPDERSGELPMAFIVKQKGTDIKEKEIKDYLAEFVSVQKQLHGGIKFVDEIPKGNTGKILRRKLKEMI